MYSKCILDALKISQTFPTNIGLKQGDVLSTILFNIYIDYLPGELLEDSRFSKLWMTHHIQMTQQYFHYQKSTYKKSINIRIKQRTGNRVKSKACFPPMRLTYSRKNKLISLMRLLFYRIKIFNFMRSNQISQI